MQPWENIKSQNVIIISNMACKHRPRSKTRMITFLHDVAKPLPEISKMHLQPVWLTKIILRLLATTNLSTTANQLSATSVLIQQNQRGDNKQNDMVSFAEALYEAPTKSERNLFFVTEDFLIHSEQYANTWMAVLIRRVTCRSLFLSGDKGKFYAPKFTFEDFDLVSFTGCARLFLNCDQVSNHFKEFSGT